MTLQICIDNNVDSVCTEWEQLRRSISNVRLQLLTFAHSCQSKPFNSLSCQSVNMNLHIVRTQCHIIFVSRYFLFRFVSSLAAYAMCARSMWIWSRYTCTRDQRQCIYANVVLASEIRYRCAQKTFTFAFESFLHTILCNLLQNKCKQNTQKEKATELKQLHVKWCRRWARQSEAIMEKRELRCTITVTECLELWFEWFARATLSMRIVNGETVQWCKSDWLHSRSAFSQI